MILGQTTPVEQAGKEPLDLFTDLLHFQLPTRADFIGCLESLNTLHAAIFVVLGIWFLFYGHKYFKAMVVINGAMIGALLGIYIGSLSRSQNMPMLLGLAGMVLLAAIAWPTKKYVVGIMGALAGGLIGYSGWYMITTAVGNEALGQQAWVGGIIGLIIVGMITFVFFRASVMIFTSLQGAIMAVGGICSLLLASGSINSSFKPSLLDNYLLLNILIGVPAVAGFAIQYATVTAEIHKKRQTTEKPPV